jgi:hypothetical protein
VDEVDARINAGEGDGADAEGPTALAEDGPGDARGHDARPRPGEKFQIGDGPGDLIEIHSRAQAGKIDRREPVHDRGELVAIRRDASRQDLGVQARVPREARGVRPERASIVADRHGGPAHSHCARTDKRRLSQRGRRERHNGEEEPGGREKRCES